MERLRHDAGTCWTADSDAALLLELRALSDRILARATKTSSAVDALVSEGARCEVRVRDACTRFRQLEDTAHVEHRVPALDADEHVRLRRGTSAASSSSLEEDPPESSRVESRYREALFVTIRTTRGRWLLPAPREGIIAGGDGARDDESPGPRDRPDHADEPPEEEDARDGPASVSSGEARGALPPPRLVGNRFWRPLPHVIGTRQFYHDENVTADWSPALAPDERTAEMVMRDGDATSPSADEAEEAGTAKAEEKKKADGAAAFATFAWDEASFFSGSRESVLEDDAYTLEDANDDDRSAIVQRPENGGTHDERGDRDGDDEDPLTESEYADDEDAFGDPFAAASYRRDWSRFAEASDDASVSSFSSASVMAASERTQSARLLEFRSGTLNASLNDERSEGFGSGGAPSRRREREGMKKNIDASFSARDGAGRNARRVSNASRVSRDEASSPRHAARLAPVDVVAMTEAALRDPGVVRSARRGGGLFDDDDGDVLPGAAADGEAEKRFARAGDRNGATSGGGLFDDEQEDDEDDEDDEDAPFEKYTEAAPATAAAMFAARGLFESDDEESDADDGGTA